MQAQCMLFLLAGYETSSTALGYLAYDLAMNPKIQDLLQKEIDEHFPQVTVIGVPMNNVGLYFQHRQISCLVAWIITHLKYRTLRSLKKKWFHYDPHLTL